MNFTSEKISYNVIFTRQWLSLNCEIQLLNVHCHRARIVIRSVIQRLRAGGARVCAILLHLLKIRGLYKCNVSIITV